MNTHQHCQRLFMRSKLFTLSVITLTMLSMPVRSQTISQQCNTVPGIELSYSLGWCIGAGRHGGRDAGVASRVFGGIFGEYLFTAFTYEDHHRIKIVRLLSRRTILNASIRYTQSGTDIRYSTGNRDLIEQFEGEIRSTLAQSEISYRNAYQANQ